MISKGQCHMHLDDYLRHGKFPHFDDMQFCYYDQLTWQKWLTK